MDFDIYSLSLVICVFIATTGLISLAKPLETRNTLFNRKEIALKKVGDGQYD